MMNRKKVLEAGIGKNIEEIHDVDVENKRIKKVIRQKQKNRSYSDLSLRVIELQVK